MLELLKYYFASKERAKKKEEKKDGKKWVKRALSLNLRWMRWECWIISLYTGGSYTVMRNEIKHMVGLTLQSISI